MSAVVGSFSGCVPYCCGQSGGVVMVEAGDGVAEADGGACGEAGRQRQDAPFAAGAGEAAGIECGDGGVPFDGGHRGAAASAASDEPGGEVVAVQERAVADEEVGACFEGVEAGGAGAEGGGEVVSVHGGLRR
jgi:hypothetical protein